MLVDVGVDLFVDIEGAKLRPDGPAMREVPTLIILHGGPGLDHSLFKPVMSPLADAMQLVYVDLRGCGRSGRGDPAQWTIRQWADDIAAMCGRVGIVRPVVLGWSLGGTIAMTLAGRHPDLAAGVIAIGGSAHSDRAAVIRRFEEVCGPRVAQAADDFFGRATPETLARYIELAAPEMSVRPASPYMLSRMILNPEQMLRYFAADGEWIDLDVRAELASIACPVLMLHGSQDHVTPLQLARDALAALPPGMGDIHVFEGLRHDLLTDAPDEVLASVRAFVGKVVATD